MDYKCRIESIIQRANRIGLPLQDLCAEVQVNKSTFYRWQQEDANPRMRSMFQALDAMEESLTKREHALVQQLTGAA